MPNRRDAAATVGDVEDMEDDIRGEYGVALLQLREDWRNELRRELQSFKNEMRLLVGAVALLTSFHLPQKLTAVGVGTALVAACAKAVWVRF